jgi:hypothetical protein
VIHASRSRIEERASRYDIVTMASKTDSRSNWHTWSPAFQTAPPAACQTLRNYRNTVDWGYTCVFAREDGDPIPFSVNTACMPWVTPNTYPNTAAFYSPATACPTSWSTVSTVTSGAQWTSGETGLTCCPAGFEGDGRGGCKVGSTGTYPVIQCGDADAEENENRVYTAGAWPATATVSVAALQLRYQASDVGSASVTGASPTGTSGTGSSSNGGGSGGLSTAAKAALGTVIPLVFILGALAFAVLWRRRKQKKAALALAAKDAAYEKNMPPSRSVDLAQDTAYAGDVKGARVVGAGAGFAAHRPHNTNNLTETPEWNVEMDATEAEREHLVPSAYEPAPAVTDASELGGMARVPRKPIAPVEIDGTAVVAEVGDAYIPYRPGDRGR